MAFGAIEAFLLGLVSGCGLLAAIALRHQLPAGLVEHLSKSYAIPLGMIPLPIVERIAALIAHTFANLLIVYSVRAKQMRWFWMSFAYKSAIDACAVWLLFSLGKNPSVLQFARLEGWIALFAVAGIAGIRFLRPMYARLPAPSPAAAPTA